MEIPFRPGIFAVALTSAVFLHAAPIPVRHTEGLLRGFAVIRSLDGEILATGDMSQVASGTRVTSELIFHFKDGSIHQETTVLSQRRVFRLLTYHLVQKGPTFKTPTEITLNNSNGQVTVRYTDGHGKEQTIDDHLKLPEDVANGMVTMLLNNIGHSVPKTSVSMVVTTPKPRIVKLEITPAGEDSFTVAGSSRKAIKYAIKVEIGGIAGVLAPIAGKQPPDTHVWLIDGKAPGFLKSEGPLFEGGPVWRIESVSPAWPKAQVDQKR